MADIVKEAQSLYQRDKSAWQEIYDKAREDLHFLSDEEDAQWKQEDMERRKNSGRPALTIDQLGQFIHQVANDVRMNTPTINVIPDGAGADTETAEVFKGKIKAIEYFSNADTAYDTAVASAIKCSIGFIRVDHDYVNDTGFEQDLFIRRVINPFACLIDSCSTEVDGSDAMHGFVLEEITVKDFKARHPGKKIVSFGEDHKSGTGKNDDDKILIAEFFKIEETSKQIAALENGDIVDYEEGSPVAFLARRTVKTRKVLRFTLSGAEVLEETTFPGRYVPIIPVYGEEAWEENKRKLKSLVRMSKDAQRLFNLMASSELETLMKQPQAPVMAAEGSIEDYAEDWKDPSKAMVLRYKLYGPDGKPLPKPERLQPPGLPAGFVNARREAVDDIKATMGIYNAALGARSNETSGIAINQRKVEGDVATYHFGDNLTKSVTHVGRILIFAIPEVHDTPRIIRTISQEEEPKEIGINGQIVEGQEKPFDLRKGRYSARVVTGPSFTTQRQETNAALTQMFSANPELMTAFGDIFFRTSDFAGAQAMAERAEKLLPPQLKEGEDGEDPEKAQMTAALQQSQQEIQALTMQLQDKTESEKAKNELEVMKLQVQQHQDEMNAELKAAELALKEQELRLKELEMIDRIEARRQQPAQPAQIEQSSSI